MVSGLGLSHRFVFTLPLFLCLRTCPSSNLHPADYCFSFSRSFASQSLSPLPGKYSLYSLLLSLDSADSVCTCGLSSLNLPPPNSCFRFTWALSVLTHTLDIHALVIHSLSAHSLTFHPLLCWSLSCALTVSLLHAVSSQSIAHFSVVDYSCLAMNICFY